jgi:hypothetical protein
LLSPKLPRDLETLCLKCLEKDPATRYATAQEFADELGRFLNDEPILAWPVGPAGRLWRWCRRKPALATVGAVAAVLLGIVAVGSPIAAYRLNAARVLAQQRELKARRNAYAADMGVVQEAIARRNYSYALQLLRAHRPVGGETDPRGWEWRHFWDLCRSDETATLTRHGQPVTKLRVSPSGRWILSVDAAGVLKVWNVPETREVLSLPNSGTVAAFSSDDRLVVVAGDTTSASNLFTFDLTSTQSVHRLTFARNGRWLAASGSGGLFRLWDVHARSEVESWRDKTGEVAAMQPTFRTSGIGFS